MVATIIRAGLCFHWVHKQALGVAVDGGNITVFHGVVTEPFTSNSYPHAWIVKDGLIQDWQTMVMGGSKFAYEGWPIDLFYETFKPTEIREYTPRQLRGLTIQHEHMGPF